jgi:hypothetical protein
VLFAGGDADDVAGTDTNGRPTARLHESFAFGDEQRWAADLEMSSSCAPVDSFSSISRRSCVCFFPLRRAVMAAAARDLTLPFSS